MAMRYHRRNGRDIAIDRFSRIIKRAVVNKYEDGDFYNSEIKIDAQCGNYMKATVRVYPAYDDDYDYEPELLAEETHYYIINDESKSIHKAYGYGLSLAKAAINSLQFDQNELKNRIKVKRGLIVKGGRRNDRRRPRRR